MAPGAFILSALSHCRDTPRSSLWETLLQTPVIHTREGSKENHSVGVLGGGTSGTLLEGRRHNWFYSFVELGIKAHSSGRL